MIHTQAPRCGKRVNASLGNRLRRPGGFTLIELLVVIAIISLLVSILLPSLTRAKDLAREVVCLTNLRNLSLPMGFYAEENRNTLPIPYDNMLSSSRYHSWPVALAVQIAGGEEGIQLWTLLSSNNPSPSMVAHFQCPTLVERVNSIPTYAMNSRGWGAGNFSGGLNIQNATEPNRAMVLAEASWNTAGWFGSLFWSDIEIGFYHKDGQVQGYNGPYEITNGSTNILLLDGHADSGRREDIGDIDNNPSTPFSVQPFPGG